MANYEIVEFIAHNAMSDWQIYNFHLKASVSRGSLQTKKSKENPDYMFVSYF